MKSKILTSIIIITGMLFLVLVNLAFAQDAQTLQGVENLAQSSNGLIESISCFSAGILAYLIKIQKQK